MSDFSWVTLATNDSYSLGALVLAHSLRRVGTQYQLVVMVTPGVTQPMREKLAAVFDLVFEVNILDSKDEGNLMLLQRPELGITFTKMHCWRLTQYKKCVFLDADTMVLQNCDELFERDEFSAAPDVGWPDCFNSGVFVYKPSDETFNSLLTFALERGSFDGGDQGLLNLYFSDWAHKDISKHLPFIYNMCSTACYSYLPAFKQYGENVKIVHFIGNSKPWLQYFNTETLQVTCSPGFGHLQMIFDHWWNLFCSNVHSQLAPTMGGLAGAFAQMTLREPRSADQGALEEHLRRQGWEAGRIDYLGQDSFDNVWKKICQTMSAAPAKKEPTPPKEIATPALAPEPTVPAVSSAQSDTASETALVAPETLPVAPVSEIVSATPETTPVAVPEATPVVAPEITSVVTPETTPVIAPETTPVVAPETTPVVASETTPVVAPETTPVVTPETTPVVAPETTPVVAPETTLVVASETTPVVAPETTPVVAPEATAVVAPEATPVVAPEATPVVVPETTPVVAPEATQVAAPETVAPEIAPETVSAVPASAPEVVAESATPVATETVPTPAVAAEIVSTPPVASETVSTPPVVSELVAPVLPESAASVETPKIPAAEITKSKGTAKTVVEAAEVPKAEKTEKVKLVEAVAPPAITETPATPGTPEVAKEPVLKKVAKSEPKSAEGQSSESAQTPVPPPRKSGKNGGATAKKSTKKK